MVEDGFELRHDRRQQAAGATSAGVREYVGAMSMELARMARGQGDEKLACILDIAAEMARAKIAPVTG